MFTYEELMKILDVLTYPEITFQDKHRDKKEVIEMVLSEIGKYVITKERKKEHGKTLQDSPQ